MLNESTAHTAALDKVYFATLLKRTHKALSSAHFLIKEERGTAELLAAQQALPPHYRQAYGQIADALSHIEKMIEAARKVGEEQTLALMKERLQHPAVKENMPALPKMIRAARHTVDEINAAEVQLVRHCEAAKAALHDHDISGLEWNELKYDFCLLLDPGPARAFYETCSDGGEPLAIPLGAHSASYLYEGFETFNWNMFKTFEAHPLQGVHHGYIVHCITDHLGIPWELIPCIKEIRVGLEFTASEMVWERSSVSLPDANGQ